MIHFKTPKSKKHAIEIQFTKFFEGSLRGATKRKIQKYKSLSLHTSPPRKYIYATFAFFVGVYVSIIQTTKLSPTGSQAPVAPS